MLNSSEYQYIKDLTLTMYKNNYKYYVCITNNPTSYYNNVYDVICYYSKDKITNNDNNFTLNSSDNLKCEFDSNTYNDNNTLDKLNCNTFSNTSLELSKKEFIYSNVSNYPNIITEYENNVTNFLDLNYFYLLPVLLSVIILKNLLHYVFFRK